MTGTASIKVSASFSEVLTNLIAELELAVRWNRPSILIAIYKTESVRSRAEKKLEQDLRKVSQHLERIQINEAHPDFLRIIQQTGNHDQIVFSIVGLRGGGPEGKDAYRALNLHREMFVEGRYRVVFWLTENEAKNLPRFAPDFWAFRHRVVEFASDRARPQNALPAGALLWHVDRSDSLPQNIQEEIQYLERNLASLPKKDEATSMRAEILYKLSYLEWLRGDLESVARNLNIGNGLAIQLKAANIQSMFQNALGIIAYETGNKTDALSRFGKAAETDPRDGLPVVNAAITYQALGQRKTAVEVSKRAAKLDSRNPRVWNAIGFLYLAGGQTEAAQASFEHAVALGHHHAIYSLGLAACHFKTGEFEKAAQIVEQIEEPGSCLSEYYRACKSIFQGKTDEGIHILKSAVIKNDILTLQFQRDPVLRYILDVEVTKTMG